ncbi:hypothetical protein HZA86_04910 [Candidatus Uhrbacteria bacterium]|nr:hypothetical protein [Candidatus Uhrbacteria bacterium]
MKILIFTEGTILMPKNGVGHDRSTIVKQVIEQESSVKSYAEYVPIGDAIEKIKKWKEQGEEIVYLTSRRTDKEINDIRGVLQNFPTGTLEFRKDAEEYKDVAERVIPEILIEDDCESIGGEKGMTITFVKPEMKQKIKSIIVKEFGGIDHLPDNVSDL